MTTYPDLSAKKIGYCMDKAVDKKMDKYTVRLRGLGVDFNGLLWIFLEV
jgi:hypothetical protein